MATSLTRTFTAHTPTIHIPALSFSVIWLAPLPGQSVREIQTHHRRGPASATVSVERERTQDPGTSSSSSSNNSSSSGTQTPTGMIPPYHWHWRQDESFTITSGRFIFTLEGVRTTRTAADGTITIPAPARHTFRADPTCEEDCVVEITAAAATTGAADDNDDNNNSNNNNNNNGIDERFFRNLYSYLLDCSLADVAPSPVQMLVFLDSAQVSLGLPGPAGLMRWVSWALGVVVGRWLGGCVLGYRASYEEYWDGKKGGKAL